MLIPSSEANTVVGCQSKTDSILPFAWHHPSP